MKRILLAASGGGHLDQMALACAAIGADGILLATTSPAQAEHLGFSHVRQLPDCNLKQPLRTAKCCVAALNLIRHERPEVVISTGAAPGLLCIIWGRVFGARTLWVDSIANAEKLSLSGRLAQYFAHSCLTQWEHLADDRRVKYVGAVL